MTSTAQTDFRNIRKKLYSTLLSLLLSGTGFYGLSFQTKKNRLNFTGIDLGMKEVGRPLSGIDTR